jgi:predicted acyl esterase
VKGTSLIWATGFGHEASFWGGAYRQDLISHWLLTLDTCRNSDNIEQEVRENEAYNEWWAPLEANGPYGNNFLNINAPGIQQAGWWDIFLQPQIDTFEGTRQFAQAEVVDQQWLWIIPSGHCTGDEAEFGYPKFESLESFPRMAEQVVRCCDLSRSVAC